MKDLHVDLGNAVDFLAAENGHPPTPDEIAEHLGVTVDAVLEAIEAGGAYRTSPLVERERRRRRPARGDRVAHRRRILAGSDDRLLVRQLLESLPERERTIVELRFYAGLSQSEIAEQVGVSQVHVSRLLRSSLTALQRAAGDRLAD